ncbi:MAG: HIRAN domain-containing protein [Sulfurimicrobium sp.]|nr:HIRAN domain-containing protein [Sulfurimicrobium sp.]
MWVKCCLFMLLAGAWNASAQQTVTEAKVFLQSSRLAGFKYYEARKLWPQLRVGDALKLVREADNTYDSNAIGVEWQGHKLGHLPRAENAALARFMDRGQHLEARITALSKEKRRGRWIEYDVYLDH